MVDVVAFVAERLAGLSYMEIEALTFVVGSYKENASVEVTVLTSYKGTEEALMMVVLTAHIVVLTGMEIVSVKLEAS